jgi:hypothetical protein
MEKSDLKLTLPWGPKLATKLTIISDFAPACNDFILQSPLFLRILPNIFPE